MILLLWEAAITFTERMNDQIIQKYVIHKHSIISGSLETSFLVSKTGRLVKSRSHSILIATVLGYYQQSLSVVTNSPWLAPRPSSYQCLRRPHHPLIFWELRAQKGSHFGPLFRGSQESEL